MFSAHTASGLVIYLSWYEREAVISGGIIVAKAFSKLEEGGIVLEGWACWPQFGPYGVTARLLLSSQNSWSSVNVISPEGRLYLPKTTPGTLVPEEVPPSLLQSPLLDNSSRDQISKTDYQDRTCSQGFGENKRKQRKTTLSVKDFEISSNLLFQFGALPGRYKA